MNDRQEIKDLILELLKFMRISAPLMSFSGASNVCAMNIDSYLDDPYFRPFINNDGQLDLRGSRVILHKLNAEKLQLLNSAPRIVNAQNLKIDSLSLESLVESGSLPTSQNIDIIPPFYGDFNKINQLFTKSQIEYDIITIAGSSELRITDCKYPAVGGLIDFLMIYREHCIISELIITGLCSPKDPDTYIDLICRRSVYNVKFSKPNFDNVNRGKSKFDNLMDLQEWLFDNGYEEII